MHLSFWIAAAILPIVGGLHRFAASYGYRGASRAVAMAEAYRVAAMLAILSALFVCVRLIGDLTGAFQ